MDKDVSLHLQKAVDYDRKGRYIESLKLYQEGTQKLLDVIKDTVDAEKVQSWRLQAVSYIERAEYIKKCIKTQKEQGTYEENIILEENSVSNGLSTLFSRFLDEDVVSVEIIDSELSAEEDLIILVGFCEVLVKKCRFLNEIKIVTRRDDQNEQSSAFSRLNKKLKDYNIKFIYNFHDVNTREIRFSNGWIVKIDRGFSLYKEAIPKTLGEYDLDFRHCHKTNIKVLFKPNVNN